MISVTGKDIILRPIEIEDAEFIFNLRRDPEVSKYLTSISPKISDQIEWIKRYKNREHEKREYYFIIYLKDGVKVGAIRVYDIKRGSFCWGSWVISSGAPIYVGIESLLSTYEFGFNYLKFQQSHFDAVKDNRKVVSFYKRFGAKVLREDGSKFYFRLTRNEFEKSKKRYAKYYKPIAVKET